MCKSHGSNIIRWKRRCVCMDTRKNGRTDTNIEGHERDDVNRFKSDKNGQKSCKLAVTKSDR